jgi:hypothetical protein
MMYNTTIYCPHHALSWYEIVIFAGWWNRSLIVALLGAGATTGVTTAVALGLGRCEIVSGAPKALHAIQQPDRAIICPQTYLAPLFSP